MKKKKWILIFMLCLLLSMTATVQAAPKKLGERKNEIEIELYNENGELINENKESDILVSQLKEKVTGEMMKPVYIDRASCTHIPCNQYRGYLYGHAKISERECLVYRMYAVICKCCGGVVDPLSAWEFQYSHQAH